MDVITAREQLKGLLDVGAFSPEQEKALEKAIEILSKFDSLIEAARTFDVEYVNFTVSENGVTKNNNQYNLPEGRAFNLEPNVMPTKFNEFIFIDKVREIIKPDVNRRLGIHEKVRFPSEFKLNDKL